MEIIVCRHTQTDHNRDRIYSGQIDIELNQTGRQQAAVLARQVSELSGPPIGAILCSDLSRAAYLARAIGELVDITPMFAPALREVNIGGMAGHVREEALILFPDNHHRTNNPDFDYRDINGENAVQVIDRQRDFLAAEKQRFEAAGVERIVIIGHGTALRLLFRDTLGLITALHDQGEYQLISW